MYFKNSFLVKKAKSRVATPYNIRYALSGMPDNRKQRDHDEKAQHQVQEQERATQNCDASALRAGAFPAAVFPPGEEKTQQTRHDKHERAHIIAFTPHKRRDESAEKHRKDAERHFCDVKLAESFLLHNDSFDGLPSEREKSNESETRHRFCERSIQRPADIQMIHEPGD